MMVRAALRRTRQQSLNHPAGYTLLELLIASVLLATLMAVAWNLMTMYSGFLVAGRRQASEQQLARSLMDLLATDLQSTVRPIETGKSNTIDPPLAPTSMSPESARRRPRGPLSSPRPDVISPEPDPQDEFSRPATSDRLDGVMTLPEVTFQGSDRSLRLIIVRSEPDLDRLSPSAADGLPLDAGAAGEIRNERMGTRGTSLSEFDAPTAVAAGTWTQVVYQFEPPRAIRRDEQELAPGLHRFEIPVELLGLLNSDDMSLNRSDAGFESYLSDRDDEATDIVESIGRLTERGITGITHEHIPEVVACRFEFYSDRAWRPEWDAAWDQARPRAVRIRLKLLASNEVEALNKLLGSDAEDESDATERQDSLEASQELVGASDPFAAFHPRLFERILLLEPARRVRTPRDMDGL
ncbi:MAG: prepilin-type N-terminal cleavage/methylation domain-containing protein, partial [Planctomycetaceae bacterium]|nr:prepilin-type N-terminal cleavage/methylation domain-containing protein [Planctomycetaceae bacterium]